MRAGAQARTFFAGFGVSGSLLAAVGAAFLLTGSVLAFNNWPSAESGPAARELAVPVPAAAPQGAGRVAATPAALALPAAAAAAPAGTRARARARAGRTADAPQPGAVPVVGGGAIGPTAPAAAAPPPTAPAAAAPTPTGRLADAVQGTTSAAARTVRSVGTAAPLVSPVTQLLGDTVDRTGRAVGDILRGAGARRP